MVKNSIKKYNELIKEGTVVIDFFATWCGPCKMLGPVLEKLEKEETDIKFYRLDIDANVNVAEEQNIMAVPTLLLYKEGKLVSQTQGFQTYEALKNWITSNK